MDPYEFSRIEPVLGREGVARLSKARVAVFGLGGVGSYVAEALARCGIGSFLLVDGDFVDISNINRQLYALHSTLGRPKAFVARERVLDINPIASVEACNTFYLPQNASGIDLAGCDYVVDAVDTVAAKLEIIRRSREAGVPIISAMGAGNKLEPRFEVADIFETSVCPLARVMRRELRQLGVERLKVVYSKEPPRVSGEIIGSVVFATAACGLVIASEVVRDLLSNLQSPEK